MRHMDERDYTTYIHPYWIHSTGLIDPEGSFCVVNIWESGEIQAMDRYRCWKWVYLYPTIQAWEITETKGYYRAIKA